MSASAVWKLSYTATFSILHIKRSSSGLCGQHFFEIIIAVGDILQRLRGLILLYKKVFHTGFSCISKNALKVNDTRSYLGRIFCFLIQIFCMPKRETTWVLLK